MKFSKVLRRTSLLVMACASLAFISCGPKPGEEEVPEQNDTSKTAYTLSVSEDTVSFDEGDDAKTITVTTNGTVEVEVENEKFATASVSDKIVTITPKAAGSTTVIVSCKEDESKKAEIIVTVKALHVVTLNIDETVAANAATISVYYEGKEDGESSAAKNCTAIANYTAGTTTATVGFKKSLANSYNYFNNIKITVKDADGNVIETSSDVTYFCYSAESGDGYITGINITPAQAEKTFKINFKGFTLVEGSVEGLKYSNTWKNSSSEWTEDMITEPEVTVSNDGTYASFVISKNTLTDKNELFIDWTNVQLKDSSDNLVEITSGLSEDNKWYSYDTSDLAVTAEVINTSGYTKFGDKELTVANEKTYTSVYSSSDLAEISFTELKVEISSTDETWASISGNASWVEGQYVDKCLGTTTYITDEAFISAIKTNGLYIETGTGTFTVTVSYK